MLWAFDKAPWATQARPSEGGTVVLAAGCASLHASLLPLIIVADAGWLLLFGSWYGAKEARGLSPARKHREVKRGFSPLSGAWLQGLKASLWVASAPAGLKPRPSGPPFGCGEPGAANPGPRIPTLRTSNHRV